MITKEEGPVGSRALKQTELNSCSRVPFPADSASPFSPDLLAVARIVQRARRYAPTPPPMVIFPDGHEERLE